MSAHDYFIVQALIRTKAPNLEGPDQLVVEHEDTPYNYGSMVGRRLTKSL